MTVQCLLNYVCLCTKHTGLHTNMTISAVARSKVWESGRSLAGNAGSNPARRRNECLSLLSVVCWEIEVTA